MILENILIAFVCFAITIVLYYVVNKYRWHQLKCHVIEAINKLNLWDKVNRIDIKGVEFRLITEFLDAHKYEHCFYGQGGAFKLFYMLGEIRSEQKPVGFTMNRFNHERGEDEGTEAIQ